MPRHIYSNFFIIQPPGDLVRKQPELRHMSNRLANRYATQMGDFPAIVPKVVSDEDLQAIGSALWSALDLEDAFTTACKAAGAAILSIIIESAAPDVQALPWETLYHPNYGFLGRNPGFTLTRRMSKPTDYERPLEKGPLRVLLFTSLPEDINPEKGRLNVEEEQVQVQEALMPWISKGLVELEIPDDGRFATLKELLKLFQPHVLFLSGHGKFHHQPHSDEAPYGEFLFEQENGDSHPVKEDGLARALIGTGVQVVVVSACESGKAASNALANGLARCLSTLGIPHVIGMRESLLDQAGIQFARAFCDEIGAGERVDAALQAARMAIQTPLKNTSSPAKNSGQVDELGLGQWCLPMLYSPIPSQPVIDLDFPALQPEIRYQGKSLGSISLPERFVGRRAELRQYKQRLLTGQISKLLITGHGGQGKTALAGKLALDLQGRGYHVFAWSARPEFPWRQFVRQMSAALIGDYGPAYDRQIPHFENEQEHAECLLELLMKQFARRVVIFLDNLESLQDAESLTLMDERVAAWLQTALNIPSLILLATSRWELPDWRGEHLNLSRASYGDYLQIAQHLALRGQLESAFLEKRPHLRRVYQALGGNPRGLEFFAGAIRGLKDDAEDAFLEKLASSRQELQANMAIEIIYNHLPQPAKAFLSRLPVYPLPVPAEGLLKLGLDLPEPQALLDRLIRVSLLEAQYEVDWQVIQYQCSPLVIDWMNEGGLVNEDPEWLDLAADYQNYLWNHERSTLSQAVITHHAMRRAGRHAEADRFTLDWIVGVYSRRGLYHILILDWLPMPCRSLDLSVRGEALGQMGKLHIHIGDYETALAYLKQSLAICQQIGDKAGEGTTLNNIASLYHAQGDYETALAYLKQSLAICQQIGDKAGLCASLFNMGHIHAQNKQMEEALNAWITVYVLARQMNLTQALNALTELAPQLGLPPGLEGWEQLAQAIQNGSGL